MPVNAEHALTQRWASVSQRHAHRHALIAPDGHYTYAALADAVAKTAAQWQRDGWKGGDTLAWLGHNSAAQLVGLLACVTLGMRWLPMNGRLSATELAHILDHAGATRWHVDASLQGLADAAQVLRQASAVDTGSQPGDAMLVYTSGTTGQPRGAIHTQAAMVANVDAAIDAQNLTEQTHGLAVLPLFHVGGLCIQTLPILMVGGLVRLHARFDPGAWLHDVATHRPNTSLVVPAVMRALIDHPAWASTDLSSLTFVNSGSQIVPHDLIHAFHARNVPVCQVYGATETGPVSVVLRPSEAMQHVGRAGRPALGVALHLASDGELWVRAPQLARGYHRLQDATRFDADGWFHTGDLAVQHADGLIEIVGRSSDLIISGGENIHPADIERWVAAMPGVAECIVVGMPDARWGEVPVLAVVAKPGVVLTHDDVRAAFEPNLARFKHPKAVYLVKALPKTALGKVARAEVVAMLTALT
jgi:fatty-acyl-CoA synthase